MKHVRKTIKYLLRIVAGIFIFIGLYFIVAGIACCISVNDDFRQDGNGVTIAVISNGVHTDIAVPAKNDIEDWTKLFPYSDVRNADSSYRYASFGWGDKGFYIETPTWADLKASTAVKASRQVISSYLLITAKRFNWKIPN